MSQSDSVHHSNVFNYSKDFIEGNSSLDEDLNGEKQQNLRHITPSK